MNSISWPAADPMQTVIIRGPDAVTSLHIRADEIARDIEDCMLTIVNNILSRIAARHA